jgi:hypothetical protein
MRLRRNWYEHYCLLAVVTDNPQLGVGAFSFFGPDKWTASRIQAKQALGDLFRRHWLLVDEPFISWTPVRSVQHSRKER